MAFFMNLLDVIIVNVIIVIIVIFVLPKVVTRWRGSICYTGICTNQWWLRGFVLEVLAYPPTILNHFICHTNNTSQYAEKESQNSYMTITAPLVYSGLLFKVSLFYSVIYIVKYIYSFPYVTKSEAQFLILSDQQYTLSITYLKLKEN